MCAQPYCWQRLCGPSLLRLLGSAEDRELLEDEELLEGSARALLCCCCARTKLKTGGLGLAGDGDGTIMLSASACD
jgi:hypothetical protein